MRTILCPILLWALGPSGIAAAEPERAEWWSVERDVIEQLLERDAGQWARELHAQGPATTAGDLMRRFSLYNRAGHLAQVRPVIDAMSQAKIETAQLSTMADFLIDRQDWPTARYFLERLPQAEPGWGYVLVKEWAATADPRQVDAWLAERAKTNPRYWLRERLRFRSDQGTAGELIEELAKEVRRQPQDVEVALRFLDVTSMVNNRDIAWLGEVCRPPSAYASYRLGKALRAAPRAAVALLDHSLDMPLTNEDLAALEEEMKHSAAIARPAPTPQSLERQVRYSTKHELLTALQAAGESQRAQKLLEELARAQPDGLPPDGLDRLAGQVQAASGARVVQQRFRDAEAEAENKQSAQYWLRRASYYTGRKEHAEAIAAYEKALKLAPVDPDKPVGRSSGILRSSVLSSFIWMLEQADQQPRAVQLLERELNDAPPDGQYAQRIVNILLNTRRETLAGIDRQWLWDYLAARTQWSHQEERLLWKLVEQQPADQQEQKWQRAEALARDGDPSRSLVLGWVMTRSEASARGIPWLKSAWEWLDKQDERGKAAFTLFDAYLSVGDWRAAETIWPTARKRLTPNETPQWLGRIAVAAARDGHKSDALRLWQQRTNLDRASTKNLDEMLGAGLREPLLAFYRSLTEQDPDCQSVDPVMEQIRTSEAKVQPGAPRRVDATRDIYRVAYFVRQTRSF